MLNPSRIPIKGSDISSSDELLIKVKDDEEIYSARVIYEDKKSINSRVERKGKNIYSIKFDDTDK